MQQHQAENLQPMERRIQPANGQRHQYHGAVGAVKQQRTAARRRVHSLCALLFTVPLAAFSCSLLWFLWPMVAGNHALTACAWDAEGSWRIEAAAGGAPQAMNVINVGRPLLDCATIDAPNASFLADPFLVVPPASPATATAAGGGARARAGHRPWFVFFEFKNLRRYIGEIGVARSNDQGLSWSHLGTALAEPFHLSYPFTRLLPPPPQPSGAATGGKGSVGAGTWLMIPETGQAQAVRLYTTTSARFPFGWRLARTALQGRSYVDTAAAFARGKWWILTTVYPEHTLHLYTADGARGLLEAAWVRHPSSPIRTRDRRFGRSAGAPIFHGGQLYRFAQDCSESYGERVFVLRVTALGPTTYAEQLVREWSPPALALSRSDHVDRGAAGAAQALSSRFHHVDAHRLRELGLASRAGTRASTSGGGNGTGIFGGEDSDSWVALVDGDVQTDMYSALPWPLGGLSLSSTLVTRALLRPGQLLLSQLVGGTVGLLLLTHFPPGTALPIATVARASVIVASAWVAAGMLQRLPGLSLLGSLCPAARDVAMQAAATVAPRAELAGFVVATGASRSFFQRLRNVVGSIHAQTYARQTQGGDVAQPILRIVVYDFGLSAEQRAQARCWRGVEVRDFKFAAYPPHVADLGNYAWKIFALDDALRRDPAVLWMDAGLELRRPDTLDRVRGIMRRHGYFSAEQLGRIGDKTHPETVRKLGIGAKVFARKIAGERFCAGGLQGYTRGGAGDQLVLQPALRCASDPTCIKPNGARKGTHHFDQSVFSTLLRHAQLPCQAMSVFCNPHTWKLPPIDARGHAFTEVAIASRRYRFPYPYAALVQRNESLCGAAGGASDRDRVAAVAAVTQAVTGASKSNERVLEPMVFDWEIFVIKTWCAWGRMLLAIALFWAQLRCLVPIWDARPVRASWATPGTQAAGTKAHHVSIIG